MSGSGQSEKNSARVYVFRFALKLRHWATQPALRSCANNRHVKGSERRHSSLGPIAGGFHVPSATPQHGNFSPRAAAVSLRQTESPPRFGGLPTSVRIANQVHAAINYENSGGRHVFWVIS